MSRPSGIVRLRPRRVPLWRAVWEDVLLPVLLAAVLTAGLLVLLVWVAGR